MDNTLSVKAPNNEDIEISVVDTFTVEEYPNKQYIAYTLYEDAGEGLIKVYISSLSENEESYRLDEVKDEEELEIVNEAFKNMLVESEEELNEQ